MIKKLQRKFVFIATMSLLVVMTVVMSTVNIINILQINKQTNEVLQLLSENDGKFPDLSMDPPNDQQLGKSTPGEPLLGEHSFENQQKKPDNEAGSFEKEPAPPLPDHMYAETPFETRYFIVRTNSQQQIVAIDISHIAAISSDDAQKYAQEALEKGKTTGYSDVYKYLIKDTDNGSVLVFMDCHSEIQTTLSFLLISIVISFSSVIVVFVLIWIFSKRAIRPVAESIEKQKQFITDAGHELKTPISVISASTEVLELTSGKNEWTESLRHQTTRLSGLVKDLLTLSKMDEDYYKPMWLPCPISSIAEETYDSFALLAESKEKQFTATITPNLMVNGDETQLRKLLSVLCDNAVKYSSENGQIHMHLEQKGKNIFFCVKNTCASIPEGNLNRLFDRFYRGDSSRSRETGGYGIGLSIAQAIVQAHKGKISIYEEANNILSFEILLPMERLNTK